MLSGSNIIVLSGSEDLIPFCCQDIILLFCQDLIPLFCQDLITNYKIPVLLPVLGGIKVLLMLYARMVEMKASQDIQVAYCVDQVIMLLHRWSSS